MSDDERREEYLRAAATAVYVAETTSNDAVHEVMVSAALMAISLAAEVPA